MMPYSYLAGRDSGHKEVTVARQNDRTAGYQMPSLFRFVVIAGTLSAVTFGGLYVLATYFEPEPREVSKVVPGVKVRR
jgi:hypothetical protein